MMNELGMRRKVRCHNGAVENWGRSNPPLRVGDRPRTSKIPRGLSPRRILVDFAELLHVKLCCTQLCASMKTNITLKLDADLLREVRVLAAEEDTSISAMLGAR